MNYGEYTIRKLNVSEQASIVRRKINELIQNGTDYMELIGLLQQYGKNRIYMCLRKMERSRNAV